MKFGWVGLFDVRLDDRAGKPREFFCYRLREESFVTDEGLCSGNENVNGAVV